MNMYFVNDKGSYNWTYVVLAENEEQVWTKILLAEHSKVDGLSSIENIQEHMQITQFCTYLS